MFNYYHNVFSEDFIISNYSLNIKYKTNWFDIDSEFEVMGNFNLPDAFISASFIFPNQISENNYLSFFPQKNNSNCKNNSFLYCYKFKNKSKIPFFEDKFFLRKFTNLEKIPFEIKFKINPLINEWLQNLFETNSLKYDSFIKNVENQNFKNFFYFQNSHSINRKKDEKLFFTTKLFEEVKIFKNQQSIYKYDIAEINFENLENIKNNYFKNLFDFKVIGKNINKENIFIKNHEKSINFKTPENQNIKINFDKIENPKQEKIIFDIKNSNFKFLNNNNVIQDLKTKLWKWDYGSDNGLFFSFPSKGLITNYFDANINNKNFYFEISNYFEFTNNWNLKNDPKWFFIKDKKNTNQEEILKKLLKDSNSNELKNWKKINF